MTLSSQISDVKTFAPSPMLPRPFRVSKVVRETYDTFTLELDAEDGEVAVPFAAGQFNMLYLFGVGEIPISISGDPMTPQLLVHTTRAVGTVTNAMYRLKAGDWIGVRGPYGTAWPMSEAEGHDVVIVTGGIGMAPVRPAMYEILHQREKFGEIVLLYGARTPEDILFKREMKQWRSQFDMNVHVTVDRATGAWKGTVGVVTTLIPRAPFDPYQTVALICGPEVMIRFTVMELTRRGIPHEKIFISMERNMKCGIGLCGHCQFGHNFVCKDGPVFRYDQVRHLLDIREV